MTGRLSKIETDHGQYLAALDAEIAKLRRLIHHLYAELNCKPPAGMHIASDASKVTLINGQPS